MARLTALGGLTGVAVTDGDTGSGIRRVLTGAAIAGSPSGSGATADGRRPQPMAPDGNRFGDAPPVDDAGMLAFHLIGPPAALFAPDIADRLPS